MRYIELNSNDIFLNLATEEYVFQNYIDDSYLLLYKNDDSIVLGKYQNAYQEVNVPEAEELGTKIARRITGGGTVFHDKGNLNYSFITENTKTHLRCYDDFLFPVIFRHSSTVETINLRLDTLVSEEAFVDFPKI